MAGAISLTKHYVLPRLVQELASIRPGMSVEAVSERLGSPHKELADDIVGYDSRNTSVDSLLLRACRESPLAALRLVWVSLVASDHRLQDVLARLRLPDGSIDSSRYSADYFEDLLAQEAGVVSRKAATNLASYLEQARIFEPDRRGNTIVGAAAVYDTRRAAAVAVAHLGGRYRWRDPIEDAVAAGVHTWLNLSEESFRSAVDESQSAADPEIDGPTAPSEAEASGEESLRTRGYREEDETFGLVDGHTLEFDPAALEESTAEHRRTQNELAAQLRRVGLVPLSPVGDPMFDVAWWRRSTFFVAEVKSLTAANEDRQIRLGLGQILDYRMQLEGRVDVAHAVLAISQPPRSARWTPLCASLGVSLIEPPFDTVGELGG